MPSAQLLEFTPIAMEQSLYYYYLNWASPTKWHGSILLKYKNMSTPQDLRNRRNQLPFAPSGGWHFSYMGGVDRVIEKMTSIVDGNELVVQSRAELIERDHVRRTLENGKDLYKRETFADCRLCKVEDIGLPTLAEFVKKYPHFVKQ